MNFRAELPVLPDLLDLHRLRPQAYPFLLQSVAGHPQSGRYDILFAASDEVIRSSATADFFADLAQINQAPSRSDPLPFTGGWFLLLGYELAGQIEPRLHLPASPHALPDALAVRCPAALMVDREARRTHLIAASKAQLDELRHDLDESLKNISQHNENVVISTVEEDPPERYLRGVEHILDYLKAGDVFQVNLSRGWRAQLTPQASYLDLYRRLRQNNPAPFAGLACVGQSAVLSSSPERLISISGTQVQTRPIAGTRPRGADDAQDQRLRERLLASLKERAEHIMLIDLERNDLGRVCLPGSVEVSELMTVESYAHVHHIVSNVRGQLRPGVHPAQAIRAVFPGGTITGCPKVRAMEIIAELEGSGRGPYTGAMGYLSDHGRLDLNILIRSMVVENGRASFRAGAGIVADSVPERELEETRAKARGLLLALGAAA